MLQLATIILLSLFSSSQATNEPPSCQNWTDSIKSRPILNDQPLFTNLPELSSVDFTAYRLLYIPVQMDDGRSLLFGQECVNAIVMDDFRSEFLEMYVHHPNLGSNKRCMARKTKWRKMEEGEEDSCMLALFVGDRDRMVKNCESFEARQVEHDMYANEEGLSLFATLKKRTKATVGCFVGQGFCSWRRELEVGSHAVMTEGGFGCMVEFDGRRGQKDHYRW